LQERESEIKFLFDISEIDEQSSFMDKMTRISQDLREIPGLRREIDRLKARLEEAQRQIASDGTTTLSNQSMASVVRQSGSD
jgi:cell division septum initiation protein DivIVA